jgi:hypothetical protein
MDRTVAKQRAAWRWLSLVIVLVAMLMYGLAAPAHARIVDRGSWTHPEEFVIDDVCDFEIEVEELWSGSFHIREGKAKETATPFFLHQRVSWYEVLSANGTFITVHGHEVAQEVKGTYLGEATFEFTTVVAGNVTVRDAGGRPVARNSGNYRRPLRPADQNQRARIWRSLWLFIEQPGDPAGLCGGVKPVLGRAGRVIDQEHGRVGADVPRDLLQRRPLFVR